MKGMSELRLNCVADPRAALPMRHAVAAFVTAAGLFEADRLDDVLTAVGEALANAVEHAYATTQVNEVELVARVEPDRTLAVDVFDHGTYVDRPPRPDRGFGLRIIRAIAQTVSVNVENGTHIRMIFAP